MIKHIPHATRIFIGLAIITLLLTYLAIILSDIQGNSILSRNYQMQLRFQPKEKAYMLMDTSEWLKYQDPDYPLAFLYPANWKIDTSVTNEGFYDIALTPPKSKTTIDFYISKDGYLGLDGLNEKPYAIGQARGKIVNNSLIGVKKGDYYYTFDGSFNNAQADEFYTITQSVDLN